MDLTALPILLALAAPKAEAPPCFGQAEALVRKVEALPMHRRAQAIELSIRRDPALLCGVVDQRFFSEPPPLPAGCEMKRPAACHIAGALEIAPRLAEDAGALLYFRAQIIASRLSARRWLSPAHERLLSTLLLSTAIARSEHE